MQGETAAVERVFRQEYGRLIAPLVRRFGDIDIAQDAAGEALIAALEKWPESGVPANPGGWLTTTASNRAIDRIRRERQRDVKHQAAFMSHDDTPHEHTGPVEDDRLRLLFTCCHPALAPEARIALTLRLLGGLTVAEIAQAFLVPETTMAQRITRAKKKIAAAKVPYRVPEAADLPERLGGVLAVLFLVFNEGYLATGDGDPVRAELTGEAIRLTRVLRRLLPGSRRWPACSGCWCSPKPGVRPAYAMGSWSRSASRTAPAGTTRSSSRATTSSASASRSTGPAATRYSPRSTPSTLTRPRRRTRTGRGWSHCTTSWPEADPSPVVALNRAVAVAQLDGPKVALALVDRLPLTGYHAWHAARAELLRRLGRSEEAKEAYGAAIDATQNSAERAYLSRKRGELV